MYTLYTLFIIEGKEWALVLKCDWNESLADAGENHGFLESILKIYKGMHVQ